MEGPYYLEICRRPSGERATLRLVDEQTPDPTQFPIRYADFCSEILKAAEIAVSECDRRHWATQDLKELQRALGQFEVS